MSETRTTLINPFSPNDNFIVPSGTELLSLNQITGKSIQASDSTEVEILLSHQGRIKETYEGAGIEAPSVVFTYGNLMRAVFLDEHILKMNGKPIGYTTL